MVIFFQWYLLISLLLFPLFTIAWYFKVKWRSFSATPFSIKLNISEIKLNVPIYGRFWKFFGDLSFRIFRNLSMYLLIFFVVCVGLLDLLNKSNVNNIIMQVVPLNLVFWIVILIIFILSLLIHEISHVLVGSVNGIKPTHIHFIFTPLIPIFGLAIEFKDPVKELVIKHYDLLEDSDFKNLTYDEFSVLKNYPTKLNQLGAISSVGVFSNLIIFLIGWMFATTHFVFLFIALINGIITLLNLLPIYIVDGSSILRYSTSLKGDENLMNRLEWLIYFMTMLIIIFYLMPK